MPRARLYSPLYQRPVGQTDAVFPQHVGDGQRDPHLPRHLAQPLVELFKFLRNTHTHTHRESVKTDEFLHTNITCSAGCGKNHHPYFFPPLQKHWPSRTPNMVD